MNTRQISIVFSSTDEDTWFRWLRETFPEVRLLAANPVPSRRAAYHEIDWAKVASHNQVLLQNPTSKDRLVWRQSVGNNTIGWVVDKILSEVIEYTRSPSLFRKGQLRVRPVGRLWCCLGDTKTGDRSSDFRSWCTKVFARARRMTKATDGGYRIGTDLAEKMSSGTATVDWTIEPGLLLKAAKGLRTGSV